MTGLAKKEALIRELFDSHSHDLPELYDACLSSSPTAEDWLDESALFRFYRKHKYDHSATVAAVQQTSHWRDEQPISSLSYEGIPGMFFTHTAMQDHFGRPALLVRLSQCNGDQEQIKQAIVAALEAMRKAMAALHSTSEPILQCAVLIDLKDAGVRNMPLDLAPFLLDLLKTHFPGSIASIFILNYSWLHSGLWAVVKTFLPSTALERIHFPSNAQALSTFFPLENIPVEYGGTLDATEVKEESEDEDEFHSAMPSRTASHTHLHLATSPLPSTRHLALPVTHSATRQQPQGVKVRQPSQADSALPLPKRLLVQGLLAIVHYLQTPSKPSKGTEVRWSTRERTRRTVLGISLLVVVRSAWAGRVGSVMNELARRVWAMLVSLLRRRVWAVWLRLIRQKRLIG